MTQSSSSAFKDKLTTEAEAVKDDAISSVASTIKAVKEDAAEIQRSVRRSAAELADEVTTKLKAAGVDTDQLLITAKDQASDLQRQLIDEIRARPMRAIGVAAAVGVLFGLMSAR